MIGVRRIGKRMQTRKITTLIVSQENPSSISHAIRTAVAGVVSLLVARLLHMPEAYWASITALIVMQSSFGAALSISAQRFVGTAVGAFVGAVAATYFHSNVIAYGICVFLIGLLCAALRVERPAYRYAGVALAVVMLVPRQISARTAAFHRFVEVSTGIGVALLLSALWPDRLTWRKSTSTSVDGEVPAQS